MIINVTNFNSRYFSFSLKKKHLSFGPSPHFLKFSVEKKEKRKMDFS